jgi:two-component system, NarL family, response regulator NreC
MEIYKVSKKKIRCVLLHQHILLRQGVRRLLEDEEDIEVVSEAGDAMDCLQIIRELVPDVLIADANALGLSSAEAQILLELESPSTKVIFLDTAEKKTSSAEGAGTEVSATQQTSVEELVTMVRSVCGADSIPSGLTTEKRQPAPAQMQEQTLTAREQEVLKLLVEGKTVRAAANDLGLSSKTVDAHKFNLMRKLKIHNKADLVMWAIQNKVVKIPVNL